MFFIPPENILPELRATERYSAIRELLQHLIQIGALPRQSEDVLFEAICQRERTKSTAIGLGRAVPHTTSNAVSARVLALGRSPTGIDFDSLDGKLVKEIILMIDPQPQDISHDL